MQIAEAKSFDVAMLDGRSLRVKYGLEIVDSIEELCEKVDGILLESVDGRAHLQQARIVIESGKPLFVDKPVADNLADVIELFRLAKENDVPCWSSSAMRFGEGVAGARNNEELGQIVSCDVFGSSSWAEQHPSLSGSVGPAGRSSLELPRGGFIRT